MSLCHLRPQVGLILPSYASSKEIKMMCPNCRQPAADGSNFCDVCGASLPVASLPGAFVATRHLPPTLVQTGRGASSPAMSVCPRCQTSGIGAYCDNCGAPLGQGTIPQPLIPPPVTAPPRFILQPANILFPFPTSKPEVLIGREDPDRHLIPDINFESYGGADAGVSRQHARVHFDGTQWQLEHLSQTNKTFVNDAGVAHGQSRPLKNGDLVFIGRLTLLFRI